MHHSDRLLTTLDEEDDEPTLGHTLLTVLTWPGYKVVEFFLSRAPSNGLAGGVISLFLCLPLFLLTEILVWGLILAVVGNVIGFVFKGHF